MKKILFLMPAVLLFCACAGMPPAWWNPGNTYSSTSRQEVSDEKPRGRVITPSAVEQMPTEENISVQDESFEEMLLTPLQDEETENATGGASAQSSPEPGGDETGGTLSVAPQTENNAPQQAADDAELTLPQTDQTEQSELDSIDDEEDEESLPLPSVLD